MHSPRHRFARSLALAFPIAVSLVAACSGGGGGGPASLPDLQFEGAAAGTRPSDATSADCSLGLVITGLEETDTGWAGTAFGEVFRTILVGTSGLQYSAIVEGPGIIEEGTPATMRLFGDQTGSAPFLLALEVLQGTPDGELSWNGTFDCAPLDVQIGPDVFDTSFTVQGSWTLAPITE